MLLYPVGYIGAKFHGIEFIKRSEEFADGVG